MGFEPACSACACRTSCCCLPHRGSAPGCLPHRPPPSFPPNPHYSPQVHALGEGKSRSVVLYQELLSKISELKNSHLTNRPPGHPIRPNKNTGLILSERGSKMGLPARASSSCCRASALSWTIFRSSSSCPSVSALLLSLGFFTAVWHRIWGYLGHKSQQAGGQ